MSPLRPLRHRFDAVDDPDDGPARTADSLDTVAHSAAHSVASVARTVCFWLGVVLPFLHVPLLLGLGLTESTTPALVGLWGLNAVAITVGAGHEPAGSDTESATTEAAETDSDATTTAAD